MDCFQHFHKSDHKKNPEPGGLSAQEFCFYRGLGIISVTKFNDNKDFFRLIADLQPSDNQQD